MFGFLWCFTFCSCQQLNSDPRFKHKMPVCVPITIIICLATAILFWAVAVPNGADISLGAAGDFAGIVSSFVVGNMLRCATRPQPARTAAVPGHAPRPAGVAVVRPAGEGVLLHRWDGIGRNGQRWNEKPYAVAQPPQQPCTRYALEIYHTNGSDTVQLGRVRLRDAAGRELPIASVAINSERCHGNGGEHFRNVTTDARRKWCTQMGYFPNRTPRFEFELREAASVHTLLLTSANDCPERDPSSFALLAVPDAAALLAAPPINAVAGLDAVPRNQQPNDADIIVAAVAVPVVGNAIAPGSTVVPGVLVGSAAATTTSLVPPGGSTPPLIEICHELRRELHIGQEPNLAAVVAEACVQLGVEPRGSLLERAQACRLMLLGGPQAAPPVRGAVPSCV